TKESRDLQWTKEATQAFSQLKNALMSPPALGLPDMSKPFFLLSHEKQGIALGILAQDLGPYRWAVAYFSKQLDAAAKGWPGCLRAVAAVVLNIQEARKFTLGQRMTVLVSHTVSAVLEVKGGQWLSPQRFLKYQAIMVEQDDVEIVVTNIVNPASFLSGNQGEPVRHDCLETIEATYSSRPDLKDTPLDNTETWFTDGSRYIISGKRHAGYAVTTCREVIESGALPTNTSAQKAEIIALTRALEMAKGKKINIYTDSRYAFGVVHAHGAIWKERGLLNSHGKNIKHAQEIMQLLEAVQLPEKVAIMHIRAHQKVSSELEEGNELSDREAKEAAKGEVTITGALIPDGQLSLEGKPTYNKKDRKLIKDERGAFNQEGWAITAEGKLVIPSHLLWAVVKEEYQKTHWGTNALYNYLIGKIIARNFYETVVQVTQQWSKEDYPNCPGTPPSANSPFLDVRHDIFGFLPHDRQWKVAVIDIKDCFFQIPLHPDDVPRFAFSVPSINRKAPMQRYHWRVLPQGMKNSPTICQWAGSPISVMSDGEISEGDPADRASGACGAGSGKTPPAPQAEPVPPHPAHSQDSVAPRDPVPAEAGVSGEQEGAQSALPLG
ncbi:uncharacterized protein LOC125319329, partial [Corvus hawaiiensis]|uniref:uncharacterized protein LOC125319329 n=1 Tax=Corvus hawaiiensis TaxID=134902 RepID=UPI0020198640